MTFACPGRCNTQFRKARAAYDHAVAEWDRAARTWLETRDDDAPPPRPAPPDIQPVPGEPVWCRRCKTLIRRRLAELDDLAALVQAHSDGHRGHQIDQEPISGSPATSTPSPGIEAVDGCLRLLEWWEDNYRQYAKLPDRPRRGRYVNRLSQTAAWLTTRLDAALAHPAAGPRLGRDIVGQHAALLAAAQADHGERTLPRPCPRCDLKALKHQSGDEYAKCDNCGRHIAMDEYEDLKVGR